MTGVSSPETFTLERMHSLTAPTARYAAYPRPVALSILRSGLVEESLEVILGYKQVDEGDLAYRSTENTLDTPEAVDEKEGEIGDGLYYLSEISRYCQVSADEVLQGYADLASLEAANPGIRTSIYGPDGAELTLADDDRSVLGLTVLRAVDILNPKTPALWRGVRQPTLGKALGDVAGAYTYHARRHGIGLESAFQHTIDKLEARQRPPDVIVQADQRDRNPISSRRARLYAIPWVRSIALEAAGVQWHPKAAIHLDRPL